MARTIVGSLAERVKEPLSKIDKNSEVSQVAWLQKEVLKVLRWVQIFEPSSNLMTTKVLRL